LGEASGVADMKPMAIMYEAADAGEVAVIQLVHGKWPEWNFRK